MKSKYLKLILVLISCSFATGASAQWSTTNGLPTATLTTGGNVGIGTATPYSTSRLHAKAPGTTPWSILVEANASDRVIGLSHNGTSGIIATSYLSTGGHSPLQFMTTDLVRMTINESGVVGIGTTDLYSHSRLHVKAPATTPWSFMIEGNASDRVIGMSHNGTSGIIATGYLESGGASPIQFQTNELVRMTVGADGKVGIGTSTLNELLNVNGKIVAEEIQVIVDVPGDYVFEKDYHLPSLSEVEAYLKVNKHLPGIPAAKTIKANGWQVGEMSNKLLEKIEELTLYVIELQKENKEMKKEIELLKK